jgi:hypothetical protein
VELEAMKLTQEEIDSFQKAIKKAYLEAIKEGEASVAGQMRFELVFWLEYETNPTTQNQRQTQDSTQGVQQTETRVPESEPGVPGVQERSER